MPNSPAGKRADRMSSAGVALHARAPSFSGAKEQHGSHGRTPPSRRRKPCKGVAMKKAPAIALAFLAATIASAAAQTYPSRPITIVVPYPAGGPTDALARVLAERMKGSLGQSLIVE